MSLARLEEKLSLLNSLKRDYLIHLKWGPLRDLQRFINICLMIFMILPDSSGLSI